MQKPFNVLKWAEENRHLLQPPVGNKQIYLDNEDYIVMMVGGPNGRKDYHWEDGEELFYQLQGDISVKIINEDGNPETIHIREGEMFLLPPRIPHSPQRPANTVGIVIERYRNPGEVDKLMWFCETLRSWFSAQGHWYSNQSRYSRIHGLRRAPHLQALRHGDETDMKYKV
jgi:3-hydroxyanthranilate 3,4-dioxygenase